MHDTSPRTHHALDAVLNAGCALYTEALHGTQGDHPLTLRAYDSMEVSHSPGGLSLVRSYASQGCLWGMDTDVAAIVRSHILLLTLL